MTILGRVKISKRILQALSLMTMFSVRVVGRASLLLVRVRMRSMQERGVDFDGRDVLPGDERQLSNAQDCSTGDGKPCSARSAGTVDDTDEGRRDSPGQAASRHGESVDLAEDLGRGRGVFEQDEGGRVDYNADEALQDEDGILEFGKETYLNEDLIWIEDGDNDTWLLQRSSLNILVAPS